MARNIASELLDLFNAKKYKQIIPSLPSGARLLETVFPCTSLARKYTLDTQRWLDGSFMNPNALIEMFGEYSGQTPLQVCKGMFKYLGIMKKRGADDCKILKNAWIALHMKGQTARKWSNSKFDQETPGDEIALYVLCKMYKRHCLVFTLAKCWTTLEPENPLSEDELFNECNIQLLYIELGVFGELRMRPSMPPAPFENGIFKSATAIIEPIKTSQVELEPLDLTVTEIRDGDNSIKADLCTAGNQHGTYHDAPLSGTLDKIQGDIKLDIVLNQLINKHKSTLVTGDNNKPQATSDHPGSDTVPSNISSDNMMHCMVKVDRLTDAELESWLKPVSQKQ